MDQHLAQKKIGPFEYEVTYSTGCFVLWKEGSYTRKRAVAIYDSRGLKGAIVYLAWKWFLQIVKNYGGVQNCSLVTFISILTGKIIYNI